MGARAKATRAEMPQPSSATTESEERKECIQRGLEGEEIHSAKRGVIFQRTWENHEVSRCQLMFLLIAEV